MSGPPPRGAMPEAFRVSLDPEVRWLNTTTLAGGTPRRRVRLTAAGVRELMRISGGEEASPAGRRLARVLLDAGLLHPRPAPVGGPLDVTVVIPVRDRPDLLSRTLASLTEAVRIVVVDDGSRDPEAVRRAAAERGAEVVRRHAAYGPACARNTGAAAANTALVAFIDSDCQAPPGWLSQLSGHFQDPTVAAVAPRILPAEVPVDTVLTQYLRLCSPLDMGPAPGPVGPGRRIRYVPSAALILRRSALGDGFDEALRYGEDVDLIWRLTDAGWQVRYDPAVTVAHREPVRLWDLLRRRFHYGTSAGPLAARHDGKLAPVILSPEGVLAALALLAGRPRVAGVIGAGVGVSRVRRVRDVGLPRDLAMSWAGSGVAAEATGAARFMAGPALPMTLGLLRHRPATGALILLGPALADWRKRARHVAPWSFVCLSVLDDAAYGAGVLAGALRSRSAAALRPSVTSPAPTALRHARHTSSTLTTVSKTALKRQPTPRPGRSHSGNGLGRTLDQALDPALSAAGSGSFVDGRPGGLTDE